MTQFLALHFSPSKWTLPVNDKFTALRGLILLFYGRKKSYKIVTPINFRKTSFLSQYFCFPLFPDLWIWDHQDQFCFWYLQLRASFAPAEINFPAYSRDEISKIITTRLQEFNNDTDQPIIRPAAITFLAAKISTLSGDVRKALDVCRRAIELSELVPILCYFCSLWLTDEYWAFFVMWVPGQGLERRVW